MNGFAEPEQLPILPDNLWARVVDGHIMLHHPFGGRDFTGEYNPVPLRGFGYDLEPSKAPDEFDYNIDWHDGMSTWKNCVQRFREFHPAYNHDNPADPRNEELNLNITLLLTDPARPDGLGDPKEAQELVRRAGIVGYTATRSVFHEIRQHGLPKDIDSVSLVPRPHEEYQASLESLVKDKPSFHFDPIPEPFEPAGAVARDVQNVRKVVYRQAAKEGDPISDPSDELFVTDIVHVNTLQWLTLGLSGLKLDMWANDNNNGDLPQDIALILPFEQLGLGRKLVDVSDIPRIHVEFALPEMSTSYVEEQHFDLYAAGPQEGFL